MDFAKLDGDSPRLDDSIAPYFEFDEPVVSEKSKAQKLNFPSWLI